MLYDLIKYLLNNYSEYQKDVLVHISISIVAIVCSIIIAFPLGVMCAKYSKVSQPVMNLFNFFRIIPSLAVLVLVLPILGTGFSPALLALILLAIPPILINTYLGIKNIEAFILESAKGMGMDDKRILFKIQIPLAMPLILTGIRTASVEVIASATLASYIGAGGLGDIIFTGLALNDSTMLLLGGISVALLSIIVEITLFILQQVITRYEKY